MLIKTIQSGFYDIGIAGGVESMSVNPMSWDGGLNALALEHPSAKGCYLNMGQTSENVAERYNISRTKQVRILLSCLSCPDITVIYV